MSLLIKALDKAQEEAQAAKAKQTLPNQNQAETAIKTELSADKPLELKLDSVTNRHTAAAENKVVKPAASAASAKLAAANALEMELSPIANRAVNKPEADKDNTTDNQDIFSITSTFKLQESTALNKSAVTSKANATSAANIFAAKRIESNNHKTILALIIAVTLCVFLAIAAYFYWNRAPVFDSAPFALPAKSAITQEPLASATETLPDNIVSDAATQTATPPIVPGVNETEVQTEKVLKKSAQLALARDESLTQNQAMPNEEAIDSVQIIKTLDGKPTQAKENASSAITVEGIASKSVSIQISKNKEPAGVNPVLMRAYDAYNAGNDSDATKLYKQVLQRDVRDIDALLGLGAIAQRQGRLLDANGWYGKVLELEPKNSMALNFNLAANLDNESQNAVNSESRIKNMLAKQPDDANLHATLGNFYADSNQWSAAQQAYFDAYRLNASADNAFNLAISLDQLGKPKLALPYYQRALQLSQAAGSNIDKAALEARIAAIQ